MHYRPLRRHVATQPSSRERRNQTFAVRSKSFNVIGADVLRYAIQFHKWGNRVFLSSVPQVDMTRVFETLLNGLKIFEEKKKKKKIAHLGGLVFVFNSFLNNEFHVINSNFAEYTVGPHLRFLLNEGFVLDTASGEMGRRGRRYGGAERGKRLRMLVKFRFVGSRIYNGAFTFLLCRSSKVIQMNLTTSWFCFQVVVGDFLHEFCRHF